MKPTAKYVLFDAANTLIHKPSLWLQYSQVLKNHGYQIDQQALQLRHVLISELVTFPDVTSEEFYNDFNTKLLHSFGIIETPELLSEIFLNCKNLPWEAFDDVNALTQVSCPVGVLSNFNTKLRNILPDAISELTFAHIFISEELQAAKPDVEIFRKAISTIGLKPEEILYIGDSMKLDVKPALAVGMQAKLIDRRGFYTSSKHRIESLRALTKF